MTWTRVSCALLLLVALGLLLVGTRRGSDFSPGEVAAGRRSEASVAQADRLQQAAAAALDRHDPERQILFGDLHVHTTWSIDAFLYALPIFSKEGAHPPADACDFARYCAGLDFFSLNDHAESLTPERWQATIDTLRACDARAGLGEDPDLIPLLGWEWTQVGRSPKDHFGHKNVVFRSLGEGEVPARPIAYRPESDMGRAPAAWQLRAGESAASLLGPEYADFMWWMGRLLAMPACDPNENTRALPPDCLESAETPSALSRKLDEWGLDSLVIPHGLAWGIHAPPGANLDYQLDPAVHDPHREVLLELFSGHGNSERYRPDGARPEASDPAAVCPEPSEEHLACCWQAGEIMRSRCGDLPEAECQRRIVLAREYALRAGVAPQRVFPDSRPEDWLDCDECRDCFKPAARLESGMTAQYALARTRPAETGGPPRRFRFGFIASSDNHRARAATGYKQWQRLATTDSRGVRDPGTDAWIERMFGAAVDDPQMPQRVDYEPRSFAALFEGERNASFMYPGGLVAVHARGRDRDALWEAMARREVYGTSGPRILLWFDLLNGPLGLAPMGSQVLDQAEAPRFRVRAAGARRQRPGCPEETQDQLGPTRIAELCLGECHHPGDTRHAIERIEVIRVRPQTAAEEPIETRIDDPWRVFECPPDPAGCQVEFTDPDFVPGSDVTYYVRALQAETPAINGAGLRPERDAQGNVIAIRPCYGGYRTPADDDCLAPVQERAWSSPIYLESAPPGRAPAL